MHALHGSPYMPIPIYSLLCMQPISSYTHTPMPIPIAIVSALATRPSHS